MSTNNIRILSEPISYQELKSISYDVKISGIYKIENLINHKVYIGQSKDVIKRIKRGHVHLHTSPHLKNAIEKYGIDNFSFEVLKETYDRDYWEIFLIQIYHATDPRYGYNTAEGGYKGEGFKNKHHTEETKRKKSIAMKKFYETKVWTEEERYKLGYWRGKHHTEEYKRRQSEVHKGTNRYPKTEEHRRKISETLKGNIPVNKGMKMDKEFCDKQKQIKKELYSSEKGKHTKQLLREASLGKVWWNNGVIEIHSKEQPQGFVRGHIGNKNKYWCTNGNLDVLIYSCPEGFWYGRTFPDKRCKRWNNGKINVYATDCPGDDFVRGQLFH